MINRQRYPALLQRHPELFDASRTVLEVGGGSEGIARYVKRPVIGVDRLFDGAVNEHLTAVRGSVLNLPFADDAFDDVVCVDTIGHLRDDDRSRALRELIRVASQRVVISGPAGFFAAAADSAYAAHIGQTGGSVPAWLAEHLQSGMLRLGDLVESLWTTGYAFTVHVNEGILQHFAGLFIDSHPFMTRFIQGHEAKFPAESPLCTAPGDVPYSYQFTIDVSTLRAPRSSEPPTMPSDAALASGKRGPSSLRLFAIGHRTDRMLEIPGVESLLAGAAEGAPVDANAGVLRDDTGDSISGRNPSYSEMTGIYWVWKNVKGLDAVGFCHYRRYFDLRQSGWRPERQTELGSPEQVARKQVHFADRATIDRHLAAGAIIIAREEALPIASAEQYMWAHVASHYLVMVNYILAAHPHLATQLMAQLREGRLHSNNMFIMPWSQFDRLCHFWFDCLFAIEKRLDTIPSAYQRRTLAFLSERLFDLHIRSLADAGQPLVEYPIFFIGDGAFSGPASNLARTQDN